MTEFTFCVKTMFLKGLGLPVFHAFIVFLLEGCMVAATTGSTFNSEDDDDGGVPKSMIIGLSVGFGSVCVVVICCCLIFKCCGCKEDNRKKSSAFRRKVAWDK